jgi:uncharacterized protein YfaS (alpha-2-macroglobulin family)
VLDLPTATLPADSRGIALQRAYGQVTDPSLPVDGTRPCVQVETVRTGDLVDVHLTVIVPKTRYFLTLEDFYPAGLEAVNPELLTERQAQDPSAAAVGAAGGGRWNPFERADLLDERAVFFSRALPAGTYQVAYRLRAVLAGEFQALPAVASETYFPEVWGRTAGAMLTVQP